MPKLKSHSGTKDRVKITKTGKIIHGHAYAGHNLSKKRASRKRVIGSTSSLHGKAARNTKLQLGV